MSATKRAKGEAKALPMMLAAMIQPKVPYTDIHTPWESECLVCGATIYPTFHGIKRGEGGCKYCAGNAPLDPQVAADEMRSYGFEPVEPYPGSVDRPWSVRCPGCGSVATRSTLSDVRRGQGVCRPCGYRRRSERMFETAKEAATAVMEAAGLRPLVGYPGTSAPWPCVCMKCSKECAPRLDAVRRGSGCKWCASARVIDGRRLDTTVADAEARARRFEPAGEYVNTGTPREHRCMDCGRTVMLSLDSIRDTERRLCPCRAVGQDLDGPHLVYIIRHGELAAVKVGISSVRSGKERLAKHRRQGWEAIDVFRLSDRTAARSVERAVLSEARAKVGYHHYLSEKEMPQGGFWETFGEDEMPAVELRRIAESAHASLKSGGAADSFDGPSNVR